MEPLGGEACEGNFTSAISYAFLLNYNGKQNKLKLFGWCMSVEMSLFGYRRDTESLSVSKYYPMYLTSSSDVLARQVQAMTGTIARWRCIIVNKPDIVSVYFFLHGPDVWRTILRKCCRMRMQKVPGRFFLLGGLGTRLSIHVAIWLKQVSSCI